MLSTGCGAQVAGVRLVAGNYSVAPMLASAFHVYILCNLNRTAPFTIDLSNSTLVLTVRSVPATTCYVMQSVRNMALMHKSSLGHATLRAWLQARV